MMVRLSSFRPRIFLGLVLLFLPYSLEKFSFEDLENEVLTSSLVPNDSISYQFSNDLGFFEHFKLEMELERFLRNQLAVYVNPSTFFLSLTYEPNSILDSLISNNLSPELLEQLQASASDQLSPKQPELQVNKLPGLPEYWKLNGPPSQIKETPPSLPNEQLFELEDLISKEILLGKLKVHFIIDPSINEKIQELLYKLSFYTLKLYAFESYEITFEEIPTLNLFQSSLDTLSDTVSVKGLQETDFSEIRENSDFSKGLLNLVQDKLMVLIILIGILFGVFSLILASILKRKKTVKEASVESNLKDDYRGSEILDKEDSVKPSEMVEKVDNEVTLENFQDFFVNHTSEIGKVFSYWIEDFGDNGLKKVHSILKPMGKNMYTLLFPYLSKKATELLLKSFHKNQSTVDKEERIHYLKELIEIIKNQIGIDSLAILKSLDKKELFSLIDLLETKEASMTLYYLDKGIKTEYLQNISPSKASEILISMVDIRTMNLDDFENLGETISQKLYDLRFFKKYQMQDLDFILDSIDLIDDENQKNILDNFKSKDPVFYHQIKKFIFSWSDIQYLKPLLLREATIDFSPEEISKAYPLRPEELDVVISLRPKREQQLIYDLVSKKSDTSYDEAKSILSKILKSIKEKIRANENNYLEQD